MTLNMHDIFVENVNILLSNLTNLSLHSRKRNACVRGSLFSDSCNKHEKVTDFWAVFHPGLEIPVC